MDLKPYWQGHLTKPTPCRHWDLQNETDKAGRFELQLAEHMEQQTKIAYLIATRLLSRLMSTAKGRAQSISFLNPE